MIFSDNLFDKPQIWLGLQKQQTGINDSCSFMKSEHCDNLLIWNDIDSSIIFDPTQTLSVANQIHARASINSNFFILDGTTWSITNMPDSWKFHVMCQDCNQSKANRQVWLHINMSDTKIPEMGVGRLGN